MRLSFILKRIDLSKEIIFKLLAIALTVIVLLPLTSKAQTKILIDDKQFTADAIIAIDSLYNRNNQAARTILKPWQERYPEHPIWLLWEGMEMWWMVLEDLGITTFEDEFVTLMKQADFEAGRLLSDEPDHTDALVIRAVANSYIARMYANKEQWITSLQVGKKGYQAHQRLMVVAPDLPDNYFAEGMKLYYSAYIPEEYPIVRPISYFLPEGNRQKGMEFLREAIDKAVFARPEATYFLATINLYYEENFQAAKELYWSLVEQYPDNGYYRRLYMTTLSHLREYNNMVWFYHETMNHWETSSLPDHPVMEYELTYWLGRAQYYLADYISSKESFVNALEIGSRLKNKENRDLFTLSAFFAGKVSEELNSIDSAVKYYKITANQAAMPEAIKRARVRLRELDG